MIEEVLEDASLPEWTNMASQMGQEMTEADYVAAQEEYELQQLIASMEQQEQENDAVLQHFGSDDEDYDQLFMECAMTVDQQYQQQPHQPSSKFEDMDAMDMDIMDG
jgi:hypothetical protein